MLPAFLGKLHPKYKTPKNAILLIGGLATLAPLFSRKMLVWSVDAGGFKGNLGALDEQAMDIINRFLAVNPVYELNMNDPKMALLSKLPLDMKVVAGAIKLVPRL